MFERLYVRDLPLPLTLTAGPNGLRSVSFGDVGGGATPGPIVRQAERELREYFAGTRSDFDVALDPHGTSFQRKVWSALCKVKYGATASYRDIAEAIDCPRGYQAIGQANTRNPIPIIVPCHRVIAADGSLGGYGGGLDKKHLLLDLERRYA